MIIIKHMYIRKPYTTVEITGKFKQAQIARQIEKYLLKRFNMIAEVEVK